MRVPDWAAVAFALGVMAGAGLLSGCEGAFGLMMLDHYAECGQDIDCPQEAEAPATLYRVELHTRTDGVIVRYVHARSPEAARNIIVDGSWLSWVRDVRVEKVR